MRLLLDEMYAARLVDALHPAGIAAVTNGELRLAGAPDSEVFAAAIATHRAVLTENVADFTRLAADHSAAGDHHHGLLIALSSRFSRRADATRPLVQAIQATAGAELIDRIVYLRRPGYV